MSDDAKDWRWVGEDGAEKVSNEHDLVAELTSGALPNYTLVWRKGWAEWLPAMQVAELAWALPPGKADTPVKPREKPNAEAPPAPPLYRYPVLKRRAQNLKPDAQVSKPVPKPPSKAGPPRPGAPAAPVVDTRAAVTAAPAPQGESSRRGSKPPPAPSQRVSRPPPAPSARSKAPPAPSQRRSPPPPAGPEPEAQKPPMAAPAPNDSKPLRRDAPVPPPSRLPRDVPIPPGARPPGASKAPLPPPPIFKRPTSLQTDDKRPPLPSAVPAPVVPIGRAKDAEHAIEQPPLPPEDQLEDIDSLVVNEGSKEETSGGVSTPALGSEAMYVAPHAPPPPASVPPPPPNDALAELPTSPSDAPPPASDRAPAPESDAPGSFDDIPKFPAPPPTPADLQKFASPQRARSFSPAQMAAAAGAVLVLVALLIWVFGGSSEPTVEQGASAAMTSTPSAKPAEPVAAAPNAAAATAAKPITCRVKTPAIKLGDHAEPGIAPALARVPRSQRVAVAYAQSRTEALGITLDPVTLDRDQVFRREAKSGEILSVAALTETGKLHFEMTTSKDEVSPAALVDHHPPFVVGMADGGIARRALYRGQTEVVFPGHEDDITTPRVATIRGVGNAIVFRRGGIAGNVLAGWMTPTGSHLSDLQPTTTGKKFSGTPTIAANGSAILVAFAARGTEQEDWSLVLATAKGTKNPTEGSLFEVPKGGPGKNLISPAVAGVDNDRFLLQWTEGSSGNRSVRVQLLDSSLKKLGDALNLSPDALNAGGGGVWIEGNQAISLFFVQRGSDHELWGSALECSP